MFEVFEFIWFIVKGVFYLLPKMLISALGNLFVAKPSKQVVLDKGPKLKSPELVSLTAKEVQQAKESGMVGVPEQMQVGNYEVADRVASIRLEPDMGVINMRLYLKSQTLESELIIHEPQLKRLMGGRRHKLPNITCHSMSGLEQAREALLLAARNVINTKGNEGKPKRKIQVHAAKPVAPQSKVTALPVVETRPESRRLAAVAAPFPQERTKIEVRSEMRDHDHDQANPQRSTKTEDQTPAQMYVPKVETGFTYVGQLLSAGSKMQRPSGKKPYEIFEAVLRLENGARLPLRGAELEHEMERVGIREGDNVAITPMGKVPVTLYDGKTGSKNLYRVAKLG